MMPLEKPEDQKKISSKDLTGELKRKKMQIYQNLSDKRRIIREHKDIIDILSQDCSVLVKDYEILDRRIYLRENKMKILPLKKERKKTSSLYSDPITEIRIEDMSDKEKHNLLKRLLVGQNGGKE